MTSFYSEIVFSLVTLCVVLWGYLRVRSLDEEVSDEVDSYTVFTIKRRLCLSGLVPVVTLFAALFVTRWLSRHPDVQVVPIAVPVALRTVSFNVIDCLACVQVLWDVHARRRGAKLTLAKKARTIRQKRHSDRVLGALLLENGESND